MLSLRPATAADIPLIRRLCFAVWPQTYAPMLPAAQIDFMLDWMYSPSALAAQLAEGVQYAIVSEVGEPVGYTAWRCGSEVCLLEKLYVLQSQQGKGRGRALVAHVVAAAAAAGCTAVRLQVNKCNPARSFYERLGFVVAEEKTTLIGPGFVMDDYVMQLTLPPAPATQND